MTAPGSTIRAQDAPRFPNPVDEPETDDNLITWGFMNHIVRVTDGESERRQRIPMIRVVEHQRMPVVRVQSFNRYDPNRFFAPYGGN